MDDDIAQEIGLDAAPASAPVLRRADDFKSMYVGNFNVSLQENSLQVSIINQRQFGAVRWARDNLGVKGQGSADSELVEEGQLVIPEGTTKQFCAIMLQSLIRKELIDNVIEDTEGEVDESELEEVGELMVGPEKFESFYESLKEEMLDNVGEE